jgi:hypothetical protein
MSPQLREAWPLVLGGLFAFVAVKEMIQGYVPWGPR